MYKLGPDGRPIELTAEEERERKRMKPPVVKPAKPPVKKEADQIARFTRKGKFDVEGYLRHHLPQIANDLVTSGKSIPSKKIEMVLKILDVYKDKKETKYEFNASDYIRIARETLDGLRAEYQEHGGICPVCCRPEEVCDKALLPSESKSSEDREVEALALSA